MGLVNPEGLDTRRTRPGIRAFCDQEGVEDLPRPNIQEIPRSRASPQAPRPAKQVLGSGGQHTFPVSGPGTSQGVM